MKSKLVNVLLFASLGVIASAQYSTGFESPPFVVGSSVVGIDGWTAGSTGGGSVTNTISASGLNSMMFDTAAGSSFRSVKHDIGIAGPVTVTTKLRISGNTNAERIASVLISTGTMGGTVLGMTIGGDGTVRGGTSWFNTYSAPGVIGTAAAGTFADRWLTVVLNYNPVTQTGSVSMSGFADSSVYSQSYTGVLATGVNVNLGIDYTGSTATVPGIAYFDDFSIQAVPEPATMVVLGGLAAAAIARKRRSA